VSGSGISWAICKSAPRSSQLPAPHHSVFNRPDALPAVHAGTQWLKKGGRSVWYTGSHRQLNKVDNTCNNERLITLHHHAHESSCRTGLSVANCLSLFQNHCSLSNKLTSERRTKKWTLHFRYIVNLFTFFKEWSTTIETDCTIGSSKISYKFCTASSIRGCHTDVNLQKYLKQGS